MTAKYYDYVDTPIGSLLLVGDGKNLIELGFPSGKMARRHDDGWERSPGKFKAVKKQLDAYFVGKLRDFDIQLAPAGTDFQRQVWQALQAIPYGRTMSYGEFSGEDRATQGEQGSRCSEWPEPNSDYNSMSPGNR